MPEFTNPFSGLTPSRQLSKPELIRAIRLDLSAEQEAVHVYTAHADATDDPLVAKVLRDIADEERVHAGEFMRLLAILAPEEVVFMAKGAGEVDAMRGPVDAGGLAGSTSTIGSLIEPAPGAGAEETT